MLRLLTATDLRPNFLLSAEISPLTEPAGPYQLVGISQSMSIRERVWKQMYAFLSRDRKVGQNAWYGDTFLSQAKTFCRGTERLGQKGWDRTSRYQKKSMAHLGYCQDLPVSLQPTVSTFKSKRHRAAVSFS